MDMGWLTRAIRPPDDITPNENDPALVPPSTVGPDQLVTPGDPDGVTMVGEARSFQPPPRILASQWSGWPADWWAPNWYGHVSRLTDTAWVCVNKNAKALASMPPYLVDAAVTLDSEWLRNPDPDIYSSWDEFAKQLFWDYQLGEAFVLATAYYSTGWPARFHVVPPWFVNVEMAAGSRVYSIGQVDVTDDICHLRYSSTVDDAHGHGPLEAGRTRLIAAGMLAEYAARIVTGNAPSVLEHPEELTAEQAAELQAQWVAARTSLIGEPAVLSGGVTWKPTQLNPTEMALLDLQAFTESRIAVMLDVPPHLVGLPASGDSMTYANVNSIFEYHWRDGLRPMAKAVMSGLSEWLLPRATTISLNADAYIQPDPKTRAETAAIYHGIVDAETGQPVLSVSEIREAEMIRNPQGGPIVG